MGALEALFPAQQPATGDNIAALMPQSQAPDQNNIPELQNSHGGSFMSGLINSIGSALTAPGDAYTGKLQVTDPQTGQATDDAVGRATDMAGLTMTGGAVGAPAQAGEAVLGSGPVRAPKPQWMQDILAAGEVKKQLATQASDGATAVRLYHPDGRVAIASSDMSAPGGFRLTRIDGSGPSGHTEHQSLYDATLEAIKNGYRPR